ncbi:RNA-guided endonuclease InsQ/TnpB family protein [Caloramator australicus]|nr:RNA-guided endonuclease TnpB family protein [Caloramator australicus]
MEVTRVIVIQLKPTKEQKIILKHLTYSASKLWNIANYNIKQGNIKPKELKPTLKENFWYKNLHSQSAQAVLEKLQIAWENCYKKHTKEPRFQPKDGHFPVRWKKQGLQINNGQIRLSLSKQTKQYLKNMHSIKSDYLWISLPKNLSLNGVQEVEIKPPSSKKLHYLIIKERNYVRDYIHKVSTFIVREALSKDVKTIAIGKLSKNITKIDIGRQNNEKLHKIPFGKLCNMIEYKAKEVGINVIYVNEGYTSQTCSICGDVNKTNRKYRGLYICKCGNVINADVNGGINILKRVSPNLTLGRSRGNLNIPTRVRMYNTL